MNIAILRMIMRHICCIIVAMFLGTFAFAKESSFIIPDYTCSMSDEQACFEDAGKTLYNHFKDQSPKFADSMPLEKFKVSSEEIKETIIKRQKEVMESLSDEITIIDNQAMMKSVPLLLHHGKKTPYVFIYVHGLWGDSWGQFKKLIEENYESGMNVFAVNLPGHGSDSKNGRSASYKDWVRSYDNALKIAKYFGDKAIVVGHSTGGLISFYASEKEPDFVKGMMLLEPAFQVKMRWKVASCGVGNILPDVRKLSGLARIFGLHFPEEQPVYIDLGCEVVRLGKYIRQYVSKKYSSEKLLNWEEVFNKTSIPTFVFNNSNDNIVSARKNLRMIKSYNGKEIIVVDYSDNKQAKHGNAQAVLSSAYFNRGEAYRSFLNRNFNILNTGIENPGILMANSLDSLNFLESVVRENVSLDSKRVEIAYHLLRFGMLKEIYPLPALFYNYKEHNKASLAGKEESYFIYAKEFNSFIKSLPLGMDGICVLKTCLSLFDKPNFSTDGFSLREESLKRVSLDYAVTPQLDKDFKEMLQFMKHQYLFVIKSQLEAGIKEGNWTNQFQKKALVAQ